MLYATEFNLVHPVNNFTSARDYLLSRNPAMSRHVEEDLDLAPKFKYINWLLIAPDRGYVVITTPPYTALHAEERMALSKWIADECANGIGAMFEEQEFAAFRDEDTGDYEPFASFDWMNDKYEIVPLASIDPIDLETLMNMYQIAGPEN